MTLFILVFAAAIGSGIVGGIFYAFSSFVMPALGRLPAEQGAAAMNTINVTVITPSFMLVFMRTAVVCLVLVAGSLSWRSPLSGSLILAASLSYLLGHDARGLRESDASQQESAARSRCGGARHDQGPQGRNQAVLTP